MKKFFDQEKNVREYIESREGYDGKFLIDILRKYLKPNSTVLEIGIGNGVDLDILRQNFKVTGSDNSQLFLDLYKQKNPTADLLLIDAKNIKTNRKFDCIYSNKVLHHLSTKDLLISFDHQKQVLNKNGILFHTFWKGNNKAEFSDLKFVQYQVQELKNLVDKNYELIDIDTYFELNANDSIYLILRKI